LAFLIVITSIMMLVMDWLPWFEVTSFYTYFV
jgi:hypothetical protein